jgi:hypothetical protein
MVCTRFPAARIEPGPSFTGVVFPPEEHQPPQQVMAEISSRLNTDVIWLSFQSVVDAFEFHHWRSGDLLRSLVFGCYKDERTWENVSGIAEQWERETFFEPEGLKLALEFVEDEAQQEELRRIWEQVELRPGRTEPNLSAGGCARKVAAFYAFPGWGHG